MAQVVETTIANKVTGMEEISKLINQVGELQKEQKRLQQTTQAATGTFQKAAGAVRGNTNVLDAQSKALRQQRQGLQQVGMQINDFATSVSTGASVTTAFNQQIGQLGYALSLTQGRFGALGRFLAGPWGAALTVAVMVLGQVAEGFMEGDSAAKSFNERLRETKSDADNATSALDRLLSKKKQSAEADITTVAGELAKKRDELSKIEERLSRGIGGRFNEESLVTKFRLKGLREEAQELRWDIVTLEGALNIGRQSLEGMSRTTERATAASQGLSQAQTNTLRIQKELNKARLDAARDLERLDARLLQEAGERITVKPTEPDFGPLPDMTNIIIETPAALQQIIDKNAEVRSSFEAIGNAVANGFKGMITGAQSFGSAMKSVIQSVIDELFRLYVVQQIVGFVTGALGGIFGGGASPSGGARALGPAAAVGGYPQVNKPVLVGERGPELFVPTSSGKIIPNHQMGGGGGMVINVDARGSSDPEAVRQQVQQGILEAAPSIVAAAQNRTINTLRRPRLAGAL